MIKKFATLSISTFVVLAISLGLIELVMRLFDPMGIKYFNEASKYFSNMVDNPNFGYIHRSNHKGNYQGVAIHTNELGLRWHPLESTSHEATVLLLGDSVVFGWGVEQEYIVASRFEKILAEKEMNIRVISAGVGSWNTRTEYEYLKFLSDTTEINYVILLIVSNDIRPKTKGVTVPIRLTQTPTMASICS